jgi:hypothetical protein
VLQALSDEHTRGGYDIILLCCYYQASTNGTLEREIIVSVPTPGHAASHGKVYQGPALLSHLVSGLVADAKLGAVPYPFPSTLTQPFTAASDGDHEAVLKQSAGEHFNVSVDVFRQQNSTLSRKYMLPMITDIVNSFAPQ